LGANIGSIPEDPAHSERPDRGRWRPFLSELVRGRPERLDLTYGLRAGLFVVVPLFLGIGTGQLLTGVLVALGTLNVFMIQVPRPARTPLPVIGMAVATNALAWTLGTLVGSTSPPIEWLLVGVGVFIVMLAKRYALFDQLAITTAVMFVVAIGLPGGVALALPHGALIAVGGLWALVGVLLPLYAKWVERPLPGASVIAAEVPLHPKLLVSFSLAVAAAVAFGLALGDLLGLPRDYWVMLTILVAVRPELAETLQFASMRVLGTVSGAALAFALTRTLFDPWVLGALVVAAAAVSFAVRGVNYSAYAAAITVFLILLLNLAYHGGPALAVDRVVDTLIGGGLALVAVSCLVLWRRTQRHFIRPRQAHRPMHPV
jgi:fusaric acid resistance family protein